MLILKHFFLISALIVDDLFAISTVNENNGNSDYNSEDGQIIEVPNFELQSQSELARRRVSSARNLVAAPSTPCGDPPAIKDGSYTLITVFMSGDSTTRSYLLSYSCKAGYRLIGKQTLICTDSSSNWGTIPVCVLDDYDDTDPTSRNTECSTNPAPAEVLTCFPNVVVRYKFSANTAMCEHYLACANSFVGFTSAEDCRLRCVISEQSFTVSTKNAVTPRSGYDEMSGGLRGPQCFQGVPITHSSCLDDSPYLEDILPNNVTEILTEHNYWRARVDPPAYPAIRPLLWDRELAITAERWAAQCQFAHNTADSRKILSRSWSWVGQSICGANYEQTWMQCISSWGKEYQNWVYGVGPVPSSETVGHYTQIINANTTHVGCGRSRCTNSQWEYILVCNYGPGGNIGDRNRNPYAFPYTVGKNPADPVIFTTTTPKLVTVPVVSTTTKLVPVTRLLPGNRETGGRRGSQCLPGVDTSHSSCLPDSANLISTVRFSYDEILDAHNRIRDNVWPPAASMPTLQWSEELAVSAERWAAQCRIAHNSGADRKLLPQWDWVGQNMRFSTSDRSWNDTVTNWGSEVAYFRYGVGPWPGNATVGHYTQIIWDETTHVGCGKAICRNIFWNYIYVCNYGPGGNVGINNQSPFMYPYTVTKEPPVTSARSSTKITTTTKPTTTSTRRTDPPTTTTTTRLTTRTTSTPRTTQRTTTRFIPGTMTPSGQMSGGLRGPQCFPDVDESHSSCLTDSPNLLRTYRFNVEEVLRVHNDLRRSVQPPAKKMPMLQYSDELAIMAERWAAQCPNGHNPAESRSTSGWSWVGQNICWKSGADETWTECITAWGDERKNWRYRVGPSPSTSMVGHYTQIIWADTLYVGCGKAYCKNTEWEYTLVCNYGPGGNIGNGFQSPYAIPYQSA